MIIDKAAPRSRRETVLRLRKADYSFSSLSQEMYDNYTSIIITYCLCKFFLRKLNNYLFS